MIKWALIGWLLAFTRSMDDVVVAGRRRAAGQALEVGAEHVGHGGGLADLVDFREGDALQTLATGLPEHVDLLLLDGAEALYPDVLDLVETRLRPGALVIADNADFYPPYLERVRSADGEYLSVPFADDVELSMRLG